MSEPTAGEVLEMLAKWRDAVNAYVSTNDLDSESVAYRRMLSAEAVMDQLDPAHLRTLANALIPPAPASDSAEAELERAAELEPDERMADAYQDAARRLRDLRETYSRPQISLEEYMAREGPKWAGVDAVAYVREMRGDSAPASDSAQVEIINPQGRVAYRRPLGHPDVLEALQRPGYSVRKAEEGEG